MYYVFVVLEVCRMTSDRIPLIVNGLYASILLAIRCTLGYEATVRVLTPIGVPSVTLTAWALLAVSLLVRLVPMTNGRYQALGEFSGEVLLAVLNYGIAWALHGTMEVGLFFMILMGAQLTEMVLAKLRPSVIAAFERTPPRE